MFDLEFFYFLALYFLEEELMLASGSQDTFVRLWKITSKNITEDETDNTVTLETQSFQAYSKGSIFLLLVN